MTVNSVNLTLTYTNGDKETLRVDSVVEMPVGEGQVLLVDRKNPTTGRPQVMRFPICNLRSWAMERGEI